MAKDKKKKAKKHRDKEGAPPSDVPSREIAGATDDAAPARKLKRKEYERELATLQAELVAMQEWVKASGAKICIVFEGRDTAGKGGTIKRIDDFLEELAKRPPDESKMGYLHNELEEAFKSVHDTAIIFTQYTDTMDYVRDQLVTFYGSKVVCWSGRGGERWDPAVKRWVEIPKVDVKNLFREGKDVKILVGTDSMSEGLNLQTCGLLINYDMPWNFMRVEQPLSS